MIIGQKRFDALLIREDDFEGGPRFVAMNDHADKRGQFVALDCYDRITGQSVKLVGIIRQQRSKDYEFTPLATLVDDDAEDRYALPLETPGQYEGV